MEDKGMLSGRACVKVGDSEGTLRALVQNKIAFCTVEENTTKSPLAKTQFISLSFPETYKEVQFPSPL